MKVQDNPAEGRYEVLVDDELAGFTEYKIRDGRHWFVHTEIGERHGGKGVGAFLVRSALDDLRTKGVQIVPTCPFVEGWIERHPDYDDLVDHQALEAFRTKLAEQRSRAPKPDLPCSHVPIDLSRVPVAMPVDGCAECIEAGHRNWIHLRLCQACGHVGCCDDSPGKHSAAHARSGDHPLIRSYEPGEDWWYCFVDGVMFLVDGAPSAPSYG